MRSFKYDTSKETSYDIAKPLRHDNRFPIDNNGFGSVAELYRYINTYISFDEFCKNLEKLTNIVNPRYELNYMSSGNKYLWRIRAIQGHSRQTLIDSSYEIVTDNITLCHATTEYAFDIIKKDGLHKMSRNHIHFFELNNPKLYELFEKRNRKQFIITTVKCLNNIGLTVLKATNNTYLVEHDKDSTIPFDNITLWNTDIYPWNM